MSRPAPRPPTLFSLIPMNVEARALVNHPYNKHLVSWLQDEPVLDIGHTRSISGDYATLATLGRNGDVTGDHPEELSQNGLLVALHKLFETGVYSDFTVTCGNDEYKVHKAIVCPRSGFFTGCVNPFFAEGQSQSLSLDDDDPQAVKLLFYYLYHLDYPNQPAILPSLPHSEDLNSTISQPPGPVPAKYFDEEPAEEPAKQLDGFPDARPPDDAEDSPEEQPTSLTIHARVYALADKYKIQDLKDLALNKFKKEAGIHWRSDDFLKAAGEVYISTPEDDRGMRDAVVDAISSHPELLDTEEAQIVVQQSALSFDLMMRFRKREAVVFRM